MNVVRVAILIAAVEQAGVAPLAPGKTLDLAEVMRRAHSYVAVYEDHELSSLVARERYNQTVTDIHGNQLEKRELLSNYMLFQLPPSEAWFALRDVHEVDGQPVADREERLKMLFTRSGGPVAEMAMAIDQESARFNVGQVPRTVNLPTFALQFLRPVNRKRFEFKQAGAENVGDVLTWVVVYRETRSPTFTVTARGSDAPASGRFWIDPATGAVLRTEMILGGVRRLPERMTMTVTYALEPTLGFRVPVEMRERYDNPRRKESAVIDGLATYSEFKPFDWRTLR